MLSLRKIIIKLAYPNHSNNTTYCQYLRNKGCTIGEGTIFYKPHEYPVDETSCHFIAIGKNCRITGGVTILAHDYSYAVLRPTHHCMLLKSGMTEIGDNVFIGMNAIVLMNTHIGNNCIVGAGSVVSGTFGDNVVIAGNPARVVCTLDQYYEKLTSKFEQNAKIFFQRKSKLLGRPLLESEMSWYVALWRAKDVQERRSMLNETTRVDGDDKQAVIDDVLSYAPRYDSFKAFLEANDLSEDRI